MGKGGERVRGTGGDKRIARQDGKGASETDNHGHQIKSKRAEIIGMVQGTMPSWNSPKGVSLGKKSTEP